MKTRALAFLLLATAAPAWAASEDYREGRIRLAEPGVTLQRVDEAGAEEALSNMPFLPGDRVWTDFSGRAEFQFTDGSVVRLDTRSKLDYLAREDGQQGDRVVLSLWSGGIYLHVRDERGRSEFQVETPEGLVSVRTGGTYRVDVERGELRLSVYDGEAVLDSGRREVNVRRGERAYARRGRTPSRPESFDERDEDAFASWDREQGDPWAWSGDSRRYLPEELTPYGRDLDRHGSWHVETEIGYVWRPRVAVGWSPYSDGRWVWTAWGWTWVPYEPWGWAPFHYGRWGHSVGLGWYWIPGRTWGPAWVRWGVSGRYVGWCPLGWRDRPVVRHDRSRGHAVPRGSRERDGFMGGSNTWVFAHRDRLAARDVAVRRAEVSGDVGRELRVIDVGHSRLTRELRLVDADSAAAPRGAVPRNVRVRPSPADTVPELRGGDGRTTIPDPAVRRGGAADRDRWRYGRDPGASDDAAGRATPRDDDTSGRSERRFSPDRMPPEWRRGPGDEGTARTRPVRPPEIGAPATDDARGRDDERGAVLRDRWRERDAERGRGRDAERDAERGRERNRDGDGDVLRRFFQPLTGSPREGGRDDDGAVRAQPRERDRGEEPRVRDRGEEHRTWQPRDDGAGRRAPERSQPQVERRDPPSGDRGGRGGGREGAREGGGATRRQPHPRNRDQ